MIEIAARLMDQIGKAAEEAYPHECCGLLAGFGALDDKIVVTHVHESDNVSEQGTLDRFEVDPKVRFDLMRRLDGTHERIIGHYHSHPDHPARPSKHDLKMTFEPDLLWLIVGVEKGLVSTTTAHRVDDKAMAFQEVPMNVV